MSPSRHVYLDLNLLEDRSIGLKNPLDSSTRVESPDDYPARVKSPEDCPARVIYLVNKFS